MEAKDDGEKRELPLFAECARFFKEQAFMCAKDEGLEVVFEDFARAARKPNLRPSRGGRR